MHGSARGLFAFLGLPIAVVAFFGCAHASAQTSSLLSFSNVTNAGCFLAPFADTGSFTGVDGPHPIARRQRDKHYFMFSGNGHIYEFAEPPLTSPCPSDLTTLTPVAILKDWGVFPAMDASAGGYPGGSGGAIPLGATYVDTQDWLCVSWTRTYAGIAQSNSFGCATFGTDRLVTYGCWLTSNPATNQGSTGSNITLIPLSFRSTYGLGVNSWAIGDGGMTGTVNNGMSTGLSLVAIAPPSPNSCSGGIEHDAGRGTLLVHYEINTRGPTCGAVGTPVSWLGCSTWAVKPPQYVAPTRPYAMQTAATNYSISTYLSDWDPWGGHGYVAQAALKATWYDDGVTQGIFHVFLMPEGWMNTTVVGPPAPTMNYPNGTMRVADLSTHDGQFLRPGDLIWVKTCDPALDGPDCEPTNNRDTSFVVVDSVNTSTGDVAFHILGDEYGSDFGNATTGHRPLVGGHVWAGYVYAHGAPTMTRGQIRCQIIDPAQLGEVKNGRRGPDEVVYHEDIDCSTLLPGFGSIVSTQDPTNGTPRRRQPVAVIPDPARQQIIVALGGAKFAPEIDSAAVVHVLNVSGRSP
jgi:hypothetical protein